ncbi:MAG: glycosyltransferase [Bacteroidaceae bacterium]|nr:glycosyltransferase [Bacteroidaceae bacterium]
MTMPLQPKFSIITVTYNASSVIMPTLQSVLSQSYANYEYILVDGGSADDTVALAKSSGIEFAHIVSERDNGIYDAMNKGIALATGDYLCFLNAGDAFYSPTTLQTIVDAIAGETELPDVLYGETAEVDAERNFVRMRRLQAPEKLTWRSFKDGMLVCHQAFYARREIAPMFNLEYRLSSDVDWCIKVMKQARKMVNVNVIVVNYLQNGLSLRYHRKSLVERFRVMSDHYGLLPTIGRHIYFVFRALVKR